MYIDYFRLENITYQYDLVEKYCMEGPGRYEYQNFDY